jgi:two-component system chemotaxis sensor kinase CheA
MRLGDGAQQIAYASLKVLDIATLSGVLKRVNGQPTVVGVTLIDGETAELIDCHALFASQTAQVAGGHSLTCRLAGEDGWMKSFLGPIIEAAGYRIAEGDEPADIEFVDGAVEAESGARKAIRLRSAPGKGPESGEWADSIYRYDRAGLMAALLRASEELAA